MYLTHMSTGAKFGDKFCVSNAISVHVHVGFDKLLEWFRVGVKILRIPGGVEDRKQVKNNNMTIIYFS
jgi:hypothetical protein